MLTSRNGLCVYCRGRIPASLVNGDAHVVCPHCGREMLASAAIAYRRRFRRAPRWIWIGIAGLVVIGLGSVAYVFRALLQSGFDLLVEETGSVLAALGSLVLGLLVLLWLIVWLLFPMVVCLGLRELRRRTSELEETTRLCARHLAQLSGDRLQ